MNNHNNKILYILAKGAIWMFIGIFISKIFTYIFRIIIARAGVEEYGLFSLGMAIVGVATVVSTLGFGSSLSRFISYYKENNEKKKLLAVINTSLRLVLILSFIIIAMIVLFSNILSIGLFHNKRLNLVLIILSLSIPLVGLRTIFLSTMEGFRNIKYIVYSKHISESIAKALFVFIVVFLGYGILAISLSYILALVLSFLVSFYLYKKTVHTSFRYGLRLHYPKTKLLKFSLPLLFTGLMVYLLSWTDTFMIGHFINVNKVGIYNVASPLAQLTLFFPFMLFSLFIPNVTRLFIRKKIKILNETFLSINRWVLLGNLLVLMLLLIYRNELIIILFGSNYIEASIPLIILALGLFIYMQFYSLNQLFIIVGKTNIIFYNFVFITLLNALLNFFLI